MKKEERLLNAFSEVNEEYIDEVPFVEEPKKQISWTRWIAFAASIVLIVFIGSQLQEKLWRFTMIDVGGQDSETEDDIENINVDIEKDAGFSIVTAPNTLSEIGGSKQLITQNPWTAEMESLNYPVYENLAYVSAAGVPAYLSEAKLMKLAEDVASKLGAALTEWEYAYIEEEGVEAYGKPYMLVARTQLAELTVYGDGSITIRFSEGVLLPEEYRLTNDKDIYEAEAVIGYLADQYKDLFNVEKLKADCQVEYDLLGNRYIHYNAFVQSETGNAVAEYCFNQYRFVGDEDGNLWLIHFGDSRTAADYMGAYAIITEEEARAHLEEGKFYSILSEEDAKGGNFSDENIAKVELTYLTGSTCRYFQPYYCFYVQIEGGNTNQVSYCMFFVPALTDMELAEFLETNPLGN